MNTLYFLCLFIACPEPPSAASQNEGTHSNSKNSSNQNTGKQTTESLNSQTKPIPGTKLGIKESDEVINSQLEYPEMTGEIIQKSIVIKINEKGTQNPPPKFTQETVQEEEHIRISGTIICSGEECDSPLLIRIVPFVEQKPNDESAPKIIIITEKQVKTTGDFHILVPKSKSSLVIEVLVDANNDGKPSLDERLAILEKGGQIIPFQDITDLSIDCSFVTEFEPPGGVKYLGEGETPTSGDKEQRDATEKGTPSELKAPPPGQDPPKDMMPTPKK